jgi:hypothetical protein
MPCQTPLFVIPATCVKRIVARSQFRWSGCPAPQAIYTACSAELPGARAVAHLQRLNLCKTGRHAYIYVFYSAACARAFILVYSRSCRHARQASMRWRQTANRTPIRSLLQFNPFVESCRHLARSHRTGLQQRV